MFYPVDRMGLTPSFRILKGTKPLEYPLVVVLSNLGSCCPGLQVFVTLLVSTAAKLRRVCCMIGLEYATVSTSQDQKYW